jgi:hypothetical protein
MSDLSWLGLYAGLLCSDLLPAFVLSISFSPMMLHAPPRKCLKYDAVGARVVGVVAHACVPLG